MKCRNCGATIEGMTCHVCGHRQLKRIECPVCFTTIFPGQNSCPKCGNPAISKKSHNVKKITPDTSVHSEYSHNYHTVSESYDYKKDAYDYNEGRKKDDRMSFASIFEPLKNNKKTYQKTTPKKRVVSVSLIVFSIIVIVLASTAFILVQNPSLRNAVATFFEEDIDEGNAVFDDFSFNRNTTQSEYNHNIESGGLAYVYNQQLYVGDFDGITVYQPGQGSYVLVDDYDCQYLYFDESGVYYKNGDNQYILYHNGATTFLLFDVEQCYQLGHEIIYLNTDNQLSLYDLNTSTSTLLYENVYAYVVDDVNRRIMVSDNDANTKLIDFTGNILKRYVSTISYGDYFANGYLYMSTYDGVYYKDVMEDIVYEVSNEVEYYSFAVTSVNDQEYIYGLTNDDTLEVYSQGVFVDVCDDVEWFFCFDDKMIFITYDSDYNYIYYIADIEGNYARL